MRFSWAQAMLCVVAHHAFPATCFSAPLAGRLPASGRPLRRACMAAPLMTAGGADDSSPFFTLEEVNAAALYRQQRDEELRQEQESRGKCSIQ